MKRPATHFVHFPKTAYSPGGHGWQLRGALGGARPAGHTTHPSYGGATSGSSGGGGGGGGRPRFGQQLTQPFYDQAQLLRCLQRRSL